MTTPQAPPQQVPPGQPPPTCPECGGRVEYDLTCHTYGQGDRFYACMPCDSAVEYFCASQYDDEPGACKWRYTHGLNPRNPRAAQNEKRGRRGYRRNSPAGSGELQA